MRHHDEGFVGAPQLVHATGHDAQRVNVQAAVRLVQDPEPRFQQGHLEDLVPLFLPATKPDVQVAVHQVRVHLHQLGLLTHQGEEVLATQFVLTVGLAALVQGRAQEVEVAHAGDLHRVLEGEEDAFPGALLRCQFQQVLAVVGHGAFRHFVFLPACQYVGQGAFAGAIGAHDGVHLS